MTKTALVTGASSGIGRGIAHKFGEEGWEVTLVARRKENLENVAKEVEDAGGKAHIFATDLTEEGNPDAAIKFAIDKMGKIGALVNNAGMGRFEMVPESDAFGTAPTTVSTFCPPLKIIKVGMLLIPY